MRHLMVLLAALGLISCSERPGDVAVAAKPEAPRIPRIAVIPKGTAHVFWQTVHAGAIAAAQQYRVEIAWKGPESETEFDKQRGIVEDYLNAGVSAIVLAPCDEPALVPIIEAAAEAGKPVVIFDSLAKTEMYVSYVATDNYLGGVKAAEMMGKVLDGKGKVAVICVQPGGASTTQRENGFKETLQKNFPGIQIVASKYGMSDRAKSMAAAEDILTANADLNAFFGPNESSTFGALMALQKHNKAKAIHLVGFDSSPELLKALKEGEIDALIVQNPFMMGFKAVEAAALAVQGWEVERRIDTGVTAVTRENMDDPKIKEILEPDIGKFLKQ